MILVHSFTVLKNILTLDNLLSKKNKRNEVILLSCNDNVNQSQQANTPQSQQVNQPIDPPPCLVTPVPLSGFTPAVTPVVGDGPVTRIKVPVVVAEPTIQIPLEATITLTPAATEIKRVKKNVFLTQVSLVPVAFARIGTTDFFTVTRAKLFVAGTLRKDIEYTTAGATPGVCTTVLVDRVVDIPFTGFADLTAADFVNAPIYGISESAEANFISPTTGLDARLDKYLFENLVKYNEQPFGELVAANVFELDFSPTVTAPEAAFTTLTEKIALELTLKVLQVQQITTPGAVAVVPFLTGLTPPPTP